jgi:phage gp29-like protein
MPYQLVDQHGRPISTKALVTEQAAPTTRGVRQPYGSHPAAGLTPRRLAYLLRDSIEGAPERYLELAEDMEERDLHYSGVLSIRKRQVANLEITVEAAGDDADSKADADLVREVIARDQFQDELVDILDAIGKGYSATEIIWDTSEGQWLPRELCFRDPRFFEFDRNDPEALLLRGDAGAEPLKPYGWIIHRAKVKSGLTIRGGIARAVAWTFLFKSFTIKDWAVFAEAYGQPLRVGKFDPGASQKDKDILLEAVSNIGTDYAAIIPQAMTIEFVQANISGSHELYEKRADWLDRQVSKVVLGATGAVDAPTGGGYASSKVHDGLRADIEDADARQLAATLNRDLVRPLIELNRGPRKKYPKLKIGRPDEEDVAAIVNNVAKLVPLGLKVGMSTMRDKIGIPEPAADEELLVPARSAAPAPAAIDGDFVEPTRQPALPAPTKVTLNKAEPVPGGDAIDQAVAEIMADGGWQPLVAPIVAGLADELAGAETPEEARTILQRRAETMGVAAFTSMLARAAFGARIAGEAEESLSDD